MEPDDKLLFAEDLVGYFMDKLLWKNTPFSGINVAPICGRFRYDFYNGFNETIREAVDIIHLHLQERIKHRFFEIAVENRINYSAFHEFERDMRQRYFSCISIDAIRFLKYCVFLAVLAGKFYKCGYKSTPDIAAYLIAKAFPDGAMSRVTWETLNMAAKAYTQKNKYLIEFSSTSELKEAVGDTELNVKQRNLDPNRKACSCFQAPEEVRSFKKLFKNRDRVLKCHKIICFGRAIANSQKDISSTVKPEFQSMDPLDSRDETQNSETITDFGHFPDLSRMYHDGTRGLFRSQMKLEDSQHAPGTSEIISDSEHEEASNEIKFIASYREKTQELFGREVESQLSLNPGSIFDRQALDTRIEETLNSLDESPPPYHNDFEKFSEIDRGQKEHELFSPSTSGIQDHWPTINYKALMKALDDIRTQSLESGFNDFSVFQKADSIFGEITESLYNSPAVTAEKIAQGVKQFFKSQKQSFQEKPLTINVDSKDKRISNEQFPDIDYDFLAIEWRKNNRSVQDLKEKPLRIGNQNTSKEGSKTCQETLPTEWFEDAELSNEFLMPLFSNDEIPTEKPSWFGGFGTSSREGSEVCPETEQIPVLPEGTEMRNNPLTAFQNASVQDLEQRQIQIGALPSASNERAPRTSRSVFPAESELLNNLQEKREDIIAMVDEEDESSDHEF